MGLDHLKPPCATVLDMGYLCDQDMGPSTHACAPRARSSWPQVALCSSRSVGISIFKSGAFVAGLLDPSKKGQGIKLSAYCPVTCNMCPCANHLTPSCKYLMTANNWKCNQDMTKFVPAFWTGKPLSMFCPLACQACPKPIRALPALRRHSCTTRFVRY